MAVQPDGRCRYGLWVNAEGKRFVNELANRKVRADAIMVEQANGKKCFAICNEPNVQPLKKQRPGFLEKMLERKIVEKYDSLEALRQGRRHQGRRPQGTGRGIQQGREGQGRPGLEPLHQQRPGPARRRSVVRLRTPAQGPPLHGRPRHGRQLRSPRRPLRTSRSAISSPPAKRRAACTAQCVWARLLFWTAWSTAALQVRRLPRPNLKNRDFGCAGT
ncbi:FAD-binding protein [Sutterella wadsworthensis]|uniref:FAD-binding protein n=1 Tax=Sutterella wadsworthensis TaxID=40545 RepID=UPI003119E67C